MLGCDDRFMNQVYCDCRQAFIFEFIFPKFFSISSWWSMLEDGKPVGRSQIEVMTPLSRVNKQTKRQKKLHKQRKKVEGNENNK